MAIIWAILLGILKWIGILLLSVIGILIILLLLILLVPIRYEISLNKEIAFLYGGKVSWLLRFLQFSYQHLEKENVIEVRILGFRVKKMTTPVEEKKKKSPEKLKQAEEDLWQSNWQEIEEEEFKRKLFDYLSNEEEPADISTKSSDIVQSEIENAPKVESPSTKDKCEIENTEKANPETTVIKTEEIPKTKARSETTSVKNRSQQNRTDYDDWEEEWMVELDKVEQEQSSDTDSSKLSAIQKLKVKVDMIWAVFQVVRDYFQRNPDIIRHIFRWIFKIILSILPRKIDGKIEFGLNDPSHTGYVLSIFYLFYPENRGKILIDANFEQMIFSGTLQIKGRVWLAQLLYYALRLVINIRIWRLYKMIMKVKSILQGESPQAEQDTEPITE